MASHKIYSRRGQQQAVKNVPVQKRYPATLYRVVGFYYVMRAVCLPIALILIGYGTFMKEQIFQFVGLGFLGLFFLFGILFMFFSGSVICRLCRTPFLRHLKCTKKKGKHIPHFLGDRSLATALSLTFRKKNITCQYCAEKHKYFE